MMIVQNIIFQLTLLRIEIKKYRNDATKTESGCYNEKSKIRMVSNNNI
jgi:hypothetical protein